MISIKHILLCTLLLATILFQVDVDAQIKIDLTDNKQQNISNQVFIFEDASGKLALDQVIAKNAFTPNEQKVANVGLTDSKIWVKLQVINPNLKKDAYLEIKNPTFDEVVLYSPANGGYTIKNIRSEHCDSKKGDRPPKRDLQIASCGQRYRYLLPEYKFSQPYYLADLCRRFKINPAIHRN